MPRRGIPPAYQRAKRREGSTRTARSIAPVERGADGGSGEQQTWVTRTSALRPRELRVFIAEPGEVIRTIRESADAARPACGRIGAELQRDVVDPAVAFPVAVGKAEGRAVEMIQ